MDSTFIYYCKGMENAIAKERGEYVMRLMKDGNNRGYNSRHSNAANELLSS
jgi:hypothetical protein